MLHHTFRSYRKQRCMDSALLVTTKQYLFITLRKVIKIPPHARTHHLNKPPSTLVLHPSCQQYLMKPHHFKNHSIHKNVQKMQPHVSVASTPNNRQHAVLNTLDFAATTIVTKKDFTFASRIRLCYETGKANISVHSPFNA